MHVLFLLLVLVITDWHPGFRALMVLSHNRDTFGLEREDTDELTLVLKGTRDSTGSSIEFKTAIENVVSSSKLDRLRSQTFQLTIGTGRPDLAIRDFQLPVRDKEKFATDLRELKRELHELDNDSLLRYGAYAAQFAIEGAKRIDCGDYAPSLIDESWFAMPMQEVDFVPVSLLRSLGLQKEIKLRVNQLPQVQAVYKRLLKAQLIEEDSEFPGSRVPKDLADCEKLNQVVYDTVVGILDDQQRARFDEILLQQYLATNTHLALGVILSGRGSRGNSLL